MRKTGIEEQKSWGVVLHSSYYPLYFHSAPSHEITACVFHFPFVYCICALLQNLLLFPRPLSSGTGTGSVLQTSTIANHKSKSIQKILWCYSILSELVSAFVYSRQDEKTKCHNIKRKSYSSWWQALDFFAGVAILMRFAANSIHINVRGVHMRLRWTFDCLKQGNGKLKLWKLFL